MTLTQEQAAYIAGFVDGEANISLTSNDKSKSRHKFRVHIRIGQVDPRPLIWIKSLVGGCIFLERRAHKNPKHRDAWRWSISGHQLDAFLPQIMPYLIVKKDQAEIAMQLRSLMTKNGKKLSSEETEQRLRLVDAARVFPKTTPARLVAGER